MLELYQAGREIKTNMSTVMTAGELNKARECFGLHNAFNKKISEKVILFKTGR